MISPCQDPRYPLGIAPLAAVGADFGVCAGEVDGATWLPWICVPPLLLPVLLCWDVLSDDEDVEIAMAMAATTTTAPAASAMSGPRRFGGVGGGGMICCQEGVIAPVIVATAVGGDGVAGGAKVWGGVW